MLGAFLVHFGTEVWHWGLVFECFWRVAETIWDVSNPVWSLRTKRWSCWMKRSDWKTPPLQGRRSNMIWSFSGRCNGHQRTILSSINERETVLAHINASQFTIIWILINQCVHLLCWLRRAFIHPKIIEELWLRCRQDPKGAWKAYMTWTFHEHTWACGMFV